MNKVLAFLTALILAAACTACAESPAKPNTAVTASPGVTPAPHMTVVIPPMPEIPHMTLAPMPSMPKFLNPGATEGSSVYPEPSPQNANNYPAESGSPAIKAVFSGCCSTSYYMVKNDGSLWAWGYNSDGELGNGLCNVIPSPLDGSYAKAAVKVMEGVKCVSAGKFHTLILKEDGSLWACGSNDFGQLGVDLKGSTTPVKVMDNVSSVAAGGWHSLAVKSDGSLWAWGNNDSGQVGNGKKKDQPKPVKIMDGIKEAAAGAKFSMALKADGTLFAWGENGSGQLGDGTKTGRTKPKKITNKVAYIAAGSGKGIMIREPLTYREITTIRKVRGRWVVGPQFIPSTYKYQPHRDGDFSLAVKTDGSLWAWGRNKDGQLGDGTKKDRKKPVKIMDGVIKAAAGGSFTLALKADGSLWTWGVRDFRQLAGGSDSQQSRPIMLMQGIADMAASCKGIIILKTDGSYGECLTADTTPAP